MAAYVIWCYTAVEAGALVSFLRQACQSMYHQKAGKEDANEDDDEEQAHVCITLTSIVCVCLCLTARVCVCVCVCLCMAKLQMGKH